MTFHTKGVRIPVLDFQQNAANGPPAEYAQHGASWIHWRPGNLDLDFLIDPEGHVSLQSMRTSGRPHNVLPLQTEKDHALPVCQIRLLGEGSIRGTSERQVYSATSHRLVYSSHTEWVEEGRAHFLELKLHDPLTNLEARNRYCVFPGVNVLRCTTTVENKGQKSIFLTTCSSLSLGLLNRGTNRWWEEYQVMIANSTNFREAQWERFDLPTMGMDFCGESDFDQPGTRAAVVKSNLGTFSTTTSLPMGALVRKDNTSCLMWQIENSGAWRWELGNILHGLYLVAGGPTDQDHQWIKSLSPGETFEGVTTALAVQDGPPDLAFDSFTQYRRLIRRKHVDNENLPVIFNDFMNCLNGNPTEKKVLALVEPARKAGAEYFVIDAGWYAEVEDWWDSVGAWEPSTSRFPSGLKAVLKKIKDAGMTPGLWLEPEVVGIHSPVAAQLPDSAFFQRRGIRVTEQNRYQLDFRHPAVTSRLNKIIDSLITDFGVGYFKLDYNIDVTQGTDIDATSPGDGMHEHRRAYLAWVNGIYDRHPDVVLESCSSGGQRLDYHLLAAHSIQSTSDLQDPILYPGISAGVLTAVTPEQSATWAYPQPEYSDDLNAFCVVNSMLGRFHLSGRIDLLQDAQLDIVTEGITVYKSFRRHIKASHPIWPLGLPKWHDDWVVAGLHYEQDYYIAIWRRGGEETCDVPLPSLKETTLQFNYVYPKSFRTVAEWDSKKGILSITMPITLSARLLHISRGS